MSTLVIYAHPAPHRSHLHRQLADAARAVPSAHVQDLYETYPDFDVDGERERSLLAQARTVVFLHPFRWYGMPSLMKEWMDVVLTPGWAYGKDRNALRGKTLWLVTSTGSGPDAYEPGGLHGRPFADFLAPYEQAAALCGMTWRAPLIFHGATGLDAASARAHADAFGRALAADAATDAAANVGANAPAPGDQHGT